MELRVSSFLIIIYLLQYRLVFFKGRHRAVRRNFIQSAIRQLFHILSLFLSYLSLLHSHRIFSILSLHKVESCQLR